MREVKIGLTMVGGLSIKQRTRCFQIVIFKNQKRLEPISSRFCLLCNPTSHIIFVTGYPQISMKVLKQKITELNDQLRIWKELFGGEIVGNKLNGENGRIDAYSFGIYEMFIFHVKFKENVTVERIHSSEIYYPVIFSDTLTFEPDGELGTIAKVNKSATTGVFFANASDRITYPADTAFSLIAFRIKENKFNYFLNPDNDFVQKIREDEFFIYQMLTADMRLSYYEILRNKGEDLIDRNIVFSHGLILLSLFVREAQSRLAGRKSKLDNKKRRMIIQIKNLILQDLTVPVKMDELVKFAGMSETYIRIYFKDVFGMSINNFFQFYRIEHAKELLTTSDISVSEVAYKLGYSHLGHFIRMFKKQYGITPKKIQKLSNSD